MAESGGKVGARNGLDAHNLSVSLCDQGSGISLKCEQKIIYRIQNYRCGSGFGCKCKNYTLILKKGKFSDLKNSSLSIKHMFGRIVYGTFTSS